MATARPVERHDDGAEGPFVEAAGLIAVITRRCWPWRRAHPLAVADQLRGSVVGRAAAVVSSASGRWRCES
jgi:hypothetical protein